MALLFTNLPSLFSGLDENWESDQKVKHNLQRLPLNKVACGANLGWNRRNLSACPILSRLSVTLSVHESLQSVPTESPQSPHRVPTPPIKPIHRSRNSWETRAKPRPGTSTRRNRGRASVFMERLRRHRDQQAVAVGRVASAKSSAFMSKEIP